MNQAARQVTENQSEIPSDLLELAVAIENLPDESRRSLEQLTKRVLESTRRRRRILKLVQEALGQLRLDMKYLMFDLDATRRERDEYRQRFEADE